MGAFSSKTPSVARRNTAKAPAAPLSLAIKPPAGGFLERGELAAVIPSAGPVTSRRRWLDAVQLHGRYHELTLASLPQYGRRSCSLSPVCCVYRPEFATQGPCVSRPPQPTNNCVVSVRGCQSFFSSPKLQGEASHHSSGICSRDVG